MGCFVERQKEDYNQLFISKRFDELCRKPNKIQVVHGNEFYNRSIKSMLPGNDIKTHLIHNEEKFAVAERFIITLKKKIRDFGVRKAVILFTRNFPQVITVGF